MQYVGGFLFCGGIHVEFCCFAVELKYSVKLVLGIDWQGWDFGVFTYQIAWLQKVTHFWN